MARRVKIPPVRIPPGVKVPVSRVDLSLRPMMWMFLAMLITFLLTRIVTRLIRSGAAARAGLGNIRIAGNHVHHQVFGILIIIGTGILLISDTPRGPALHQAGQAGFLVGITPLRQSAEKRQARRTSLRPAAPGALEPAARSRAGAPSQEGPG